MNKAQLVEAIADKLGGRQQAADAVDVVLDAIVRAVVAGDRVSVTGFGSFEKVERPARYARNPQTGERVRVKKTSVPRFRAGQGFKDLVSGAKKLPKGGEVAVKKAPKGSLSGGAGATTRKAAAKKAAARKTAAKATPAKKTAAKKTTAKKTAAKATPAKKTAAKKTTAKKTTGKKSAGKTVAKKAPAKKAPGRRTSARKRAATRKK
ncbi:HU family DNA-binding protein [Streptomyces sp. SS8]